MDDYDSIIILNNKNYKIGVLTESLYFKKFIRKKNVPKTNQTRNCFVFNMVFGNVSGVSDVIIKETE